MDSQYNVLIDTVGVVLVCAILIAERMQKKRGDPVVSRLLHALLICCTLVFLIDIPGLLLDGIVFPGARGCLWVLDSMYWALQIVFCWLWALFADYWSFDSPEHLKKVAIPYGLPMVAELLLVAINPLTGWIFTIDSSNVYVRGAFYHLNMGLFGLYILVAIVSTVVGYLVSRDPRSKRRKLFLVVYMFLPVCGVIFDIFVYGISWVWPMAALSLLMAYLDVQQQMITEEQLATAKMEKELTESRMAMMLSQIQPHFLYNALSSIAELCTENPQKAKQATVEFSHFLRGNLASLTADMPISFQQELEHTQNYLALELLRFPDRLKVDYQIETTSFRLPTLSLQPIVENAVRYGVTKCKMGIRVTISTREFPDAYTVTVTDNGAGFDPLSINEDGRSHVGIQNVRDRLTRMCGGRLEILSTPGMGTVAVITLPKENRNDLFSVGR